MPLVLSMKQDEKVMIGGQIFRIDSINEEGFVIEAGFEAWRITGDRAMEIAPDVMVSAGFNEDRPCARVVIDAPLSVKIKRIVE